CGQIAHSVFSWPKLFPDTISHSQYHASAAEHLFSGIFMRRSLKASFLGLLLLLLCQAVAAQGPEFSISFPKERSAAPLDGRVFVLLSTDPSGEPRNQISISYKTQAIFGLDVNQVKPGEAIVLNDKNAFGYPVRYLHDLKPGEYYVQVLLHKYETFHRADGHTLKLPMDRGEGQHWNSAPGNLYSKP